MELPDICRLMETLSPFNKLLGLRVELLEAGHAVVWLTPRPEFIGDPRRATLHGGVLSALIDTAGGAAAWSTLEPMEDAVSTVDLRVDYLEPATVGADLRAEARLRRKGNRVCHVQVEMTQGGTAIATGVGVYNIHRGARS
jgi:uncharacterized protein (TIGR00369 family)